MTGVQTCALPIYFNGIWSALNTHLDVYSVKTSSAQSTFDYHWSDSDFIDNQIKIIQGN